MRIGGDNLIPNGNIDLSEAWTSPAIQLSHIIDYSIQLFFTGTLAGSFYLQSSSDNGEEIMVTEPLREQKVIHWTTIFRSEQLIAAAGDHTWAARDAGYKWVRVVWAPTSGDGVLTSARFNVKGF